MGTKEYEKYVHCNLPINDISKIVSVEELLDGDIIIFKLNNGTYYEYYESIKSYKYYENARDMYYFHREISNETRMQSFRYKFQKIMNDYGLKQDYIAKKINVSQGSVSNYLEGTRMPSIGTMLDICKLVANVTNEYKDELDILTYFLTVEVADFYKNEYLSSLVKHYVKK